MCKRELTEFFAKLTEFAPKLSEAQWVLFSETALSKQYSARFLLHWESANSLQQCLTGASWKVLWRALRRVLWEIGVLKEVLWWGALEGLPCASEDALHAVSLHWAFLGSTFQSTLQSTSLSTPISHCDFTAILLREKLANSKLWLAIASDLWLPWRGSQSLCAFFACEDMFCFPQSTLQSTRQSTFRDVPVKHCCSRSADSQHLHFYSF